MQTSRKAAMGFIFVTLLIDVMGFGLIIPVLANLISALKGIPFNKASIYGGYLLMAFAGTQFLFSPVIGNLSDRYGRRPVLPKFVVWVWHRLHHPGPGARIRLAVHRPRHRRYHRRQFYHRNRLYCRYQPRPCPKSQELRIDRRRFWHRASSSAPPSAASWRFGASAHLSTAPPPFACLTASLDISSFLNHSRGRIAAPLTGNARIPSAR